MNVNLNNEDSVDFYRSRNIITKIKAKEKNFKLRKPKKKKTLFFKKKGEHKICNIMADYGRI